MMTLLRFRVANHASIRDEQTLSLVAVSRRGEPHTSKVPSTVNVAGIYGPNASGKSNVLDALRYMMYAIRDSHTRWSPDNGISRRPFAPGAGEGDSFSFFEVDFLYDAVRYSYGFELDDDSVGAEWLYSFPHGKARRLFQRTGPHEYQFGRFLGGENGRIEKLTRENSLFLSSAASNDHPVLRNLSRALISRIRFASQNSVNENARIRFTQQMLEDVRMEPLVNRLLNAADLGISRLELRKLPLSPEHAEIHRRMRAEGKPDSGLRDHETVVRFVHDMGDGRQMSLPFSEESAGTQVWLSLVGPILYVLRNGLTLVVDEVDSSLHPHLSSTIIRMFKDPEVNVRNAQLVFASHDTTLLGTMLDDRLLDRDEVWFTEKDPSGATSLYGLAEFKPRRDENVERGYLQGRYGAVPYLSFDRIREVLLDVRKEEDDASARPPAPEPEGRSA